ncbi:MAG TPA: TlpA disulfide reductase family protein [Sphingobacterium sp.]|nr:TlpA disulfide reductase family protein [Sphingobacterium sp.]
MKHFLWVVITSMLYCFQANAQYTTISGTIDPGAGQKVILYKIYNGRLVEISAITPNTDGRFGFRFAPDYEGLYVIGTGNSVSSFGKRRFYFRGNEELDIELLPNGYVLKSSNHSPETMALYNWDKITESIRDKSFTPGGESTFKDFYPEIEEIAAKLENMKKEVKTGNKNFDTFFPQLVDYDLAYYATQYGNIPRKAHPQPADMTNYYRQFDPDKYLAADLLKYPYGDAWMLHLIGRKLDFSKMPTDDDILPLIPADVLKGQYLAFKAAKAPSYAQWKVFYDKYKDYLILPEQQERVQAVGNKFIVAEGEPAFNFSFPDVTGKNISLAELKGKIVLVDLWATWCGPCKAEEPHWEKLYEEYAGKDIVFVGISVDKDKSAWGKYVQEKNLRGIQLHAGQGNLLSKAYDVTGIPRYILIDKNGNLIDARSPRPSDPRLKAVIDLCLQR